MAAKAITWISNNHLDGRCVPITHRKRRPYPEVTGYFIPTLLAIGQINLAENFARFLVTVQNPDGSFSLDNPKDKYVFDTGQIIRGWVAIVDRMPELQAPLQKACQWIVRGADPVTGRLAVPAPNGAWSLGARGEVSEGIHLYVLKPLFDAARVLNDRDIEECANKALNYYLKEVQVSDFEQSNMLTHFYGYMQEALVELGQIERARQGMASIAKYQKQNGAVAAYFDVPWVCSTGLAQLAITWYLLGETQRADAALRYVAQLQNGSGGFYGSYGVGAAYFPTEEIPWAVKYALDGEQAKIAHHFNVTAHHYAQTMDASDGRAQAILEDVKAYDRVLDAGCGNGRYAVLVSQHQPTAQVHAVDISAEMLKAIPSEIHTRQSTIQSLPYPDGHFDVVFCVEALEHAPNPAAAIKEFSRVLKPNGRLLIIDKNQAKLGQLKIEAWEQWFDVEALTGQIQAHGMTAEAQFVGYDRRPPDGLFVAWRGAKTQQAKPEGANSQGSINYYRKDYFNEANAQLVAACIRKDKAWIEKHLRDQDSANSTLHADEMYANKFGMQLIRKMINIEAARYDILDVACGNADLLRKLHDDGHRVQGVDASAIRVGNTKDIPIHWGFCESLPVSDQSNDILIALGCMEHVYDLDQSLRECLRVLKPGGLLFCEVPYGKFADGVNHVRLFNPDLLFGALSGVGFEVIELWTIPDLIGEPQNNLFIIASKPINVSAAHKLVSALKKFNQV